MIEPEQVTEARRLLDAHTTIWIVWDAYRSDKDWISCDDGDVQSALEVALDQIDIALLNLNGVEMTVTPPN